MNLLALLLVIPLIIIWILSLCVVGVIAYIVGTWKGAEDTLNDAETWRKLWERNNLEGKNDV